MSALFIILVGLTITWYSEKIPISNRCIRGLMPNLIKKSWTVSIAHGLECTSELRSIYVQWCTFSLDFSFVITNYGCVWWILMLKQNSNHVTLMHLSTFFLSPFLLLHFARLTGRGVTWVTFFHNYLGLLTLVAQWNEIPFEVAFVNLCSVYWNKRF